MKYIGLLSSAASGKLGGVVASHNRNGTYFRHHAIPVQPRTPAQRAVRNQLAAFSSAFKSLTATQVAGWNALGATVTLKSKLGTTYNPTGQQLFVSCNKHLAEIGITTLLTTAPTIPTIPAIPELTISGGSSQASPANVSALTITAPASFESDFGVVIRATSVQTWGRTFMGKSLFRTIAGYGSGSAVVMNVLTAYTARFGPLPQAGQIQFEAYYVDPASGFKGAAVTGQVGFYQVAGTDMFSASAASSALTLSIATGDVTDVISLTNNDASAYSVVAAIAGVPPDVAASFSANPVPISGGAGTGTGTVTLTLAKVTGLTAGGPYNLTLTLSYGTDVVTIPLTLTVTA